MERKERLQESIKELLSAEKKKASMVGTELKAGGGNHITNLGLATGQQQMVILITDEDRRVYDAFNLHEILELAAGQNINPDGRVSDYSAADHSLKAAEIEFGDFVSKIKFRNSRIKYFTESDRIHLAALALLTGADREIAALGAEVDPEKLKRLKRKFTRVLTEAGRLIEGADLKAKKVRIN